MQAMKIMGKNKKIKNILIIISPTLLNALKDHYLIIKIPH